MYSFNLSDKARRIKWKKQAILIFITLAIIDSIVQAIINFEDYLIYLIRIIVVISFQISFSYTLDKNESHANYIIFIMMNLIVFLIFYWQDDLKYILAGATLVLPLVTQFFTQSRNLTLLSTACIQFQYIFFFYPKLQEKAGLFKEKDYLIQTYVTQIVSTSIVIFIILFLFKQIDFIQTQLMEEQQKAQDYANKLNSFLQSFSHELRNPLNTLQGSLTLAQQEKHDPQKLQKHISTSLMCTSIILQFVNNILDAGKSDVGKLEITKKPLKLKETIENLWLIIVPLLKSKQLMGTVHFNQKIPEVLYFDKTRMTQILMNLLSNAQKFTQQGQVKLKFDWIQNRSKVDENQDFYSEYSTTQEYLDTESNIQNLMLDDRFEEEINESNKQITMYQANTSSNLDTNYDILTTSKLQFKKQQTLYYKVVQGILRISVQDTGEGISQDDMPKLFQKFSQVSKSKTDSQKGTGLGLNITQEIIKQSGGDIKAFSKEGRGTEFIACLPTYYDPIFELENLKNLDIFKTLQQKKLKYLLFNDAEHENKIIQNLMDSLEGELLFKSILCQQAPSIYKNILKVKQQTVDLIIMKTRGIIHNVSQLYNQIRKIENKLQKQNCRCQIVFLGKVKQEEIERMQGSFKSVIQPINIYELFENIFLESN